MCDYCQWIKEVKIVDPLCGNTRILEEPKLEPIIIIHGDASDKKVSDRSTILNPMKKVLIEAYKLLIHGENAIDVLEKAILQLENEYSMKNQISSIKSVSLVDDGGRIGCLTGSSKSCSFAEAKKLLGESQNVIILQEKKNENTKDVVNTRKKREENYECWCVIIRDKKGKLICGRLNWGSPDDSVPSISAATTIYGCGYFIKNQTCLSISGKDELIFIKASARRLIRLIKMVKRHLCAKKEINKFMMEFKGEMLGLVFLGEFNRPVIYSKEKFFPWGYCSKNMINYGLSADELISEDALSDGESNCQCHWRYERYSPKI